MTATVQEFYQGALLADAAYISFSPDSSEGPKLYQEKRCQIYFLNPENKSETF